MIIFSACLGLLMNQISAAYDETQQRRGRMVSLSKYMSWRAVPRPLRYSIRQYLAFVWETEEDAGDTETEVFSRLSATLKKELCQHIFGRVLYGAPFLSWMHDELPAMRRLATTAQSLF